MEQTVVLKEKEKNEDISLLKYFENRKVPIDHECGGMGICGTCRVVVMKSPAELPELNEFEKLRLDEFACEKNERLACQLPAIDGLKIRIPRVD